MIQATQLLLLDPSELVFPKFNAQGMPSSESTGCCNRTVRLILISLLLVGSQISYDAVSIVAPYLKRERGVAGEKLGGLYAAYHAVNIFICAVVGGVIDQCGAARMSLVLSLVVLSSCCVFALATSYEVMILSRLILGVGGEALNVAQMALLNASFGPQSNPDQSFPSLAVSYGVALIVMRVSVLVAFQVLPLLIDARGWVGMWSVAGAAAISVVAAVVLVTMRTEGDERGSVCCAVRRAHFADGGADLSRKPSKDDSERQGTVHWDSDFRGSDSSCDGDSTSADCRRLMEEQETPPPRRNATHAVSGGGNIAESLPPDSSRSRGGHRRKLRDAGANCAAMSGALDCARRTNRRVCSWAFALTTALLLVYSGSTMPFGEYSVDLYSSPLLGSHSPVAAARVASLSTFVGIIATLPL
jgi:hypothetical protein